MVSGPFSRFANATEQRELEMQAKLANISNMTGSLSDIAAQTGLTGGSIDSSAIPSVGGLANMKATGGTLSNQRIINSKNQIKGLPGYVKSYRSYLQWRYPSRYGAGTDYSVTPNTNNGYDIPDITGGEFKPPAPGVLP